MFNKKIFASKLIMLRKNSGLSTRKLGEIIGISHSAITQFEKGNALPALDTLVAMANYFGVSTDYLLGLEDIQYMNESDSKMYIAEGKINKVKHISPNEINELINDLEEDSINELKKYVDYLKIRQTLDKGNNESSAGLDSAGNK